VGLLADFIVSTPEDALQYESLFRSGEAIPPDRFQRAEYKNFTTLSLEILWAILRHKQWDAKRHLLEHVYHTGEGESWLDRFPDDLVHRLSALNEADLNQAADAWQCREVPGNADELLPVLCDLKQLAIQAEMHGRNLYLWGSL
jgi:hypothetical protein